MFTRLASISSFHISMLSLVAGFLLMISGYVPFAVIGAALILFSFLLPFIRLGIKPGRPATSSERTAETENEAKPSRIAEPRRTDDAR